MRFSCTLPLAQLTHAEKKEKKNRMMEKGASKGALDPTPLHGCGWGRGGSMGLVMGKKGGGGGGAITLFPLAHSRREGVWPKVALLLFLLLSRDREKTDRARKEAFSSSSSFLLWAPLDRPSPILPLSGVCVRAGIQGEGKRYRPLQGICH